MIVYQVINLFLYQKHMLWVLKRTAAIRRFLKHQIIGQIWWVRKYLQFYTQKLCLSRLLCIQYVGMIHLSEQVKLAELET